MQSFLKQIPPEIYAGIIIFIVSIVGILAIFIIKSVIKVINNMVTNVKTLQDFYLQNNININNLKNEIEKNKEKIRDDLLPILRRHEERIDGNRSDINNIIVTVNAVQCEGISKINPLNN